MQKAKVDVYKMVTDKIIAELEAGRMPWIKPWTCTDYSGMPHNGMSKKAYRGINVMLLWLSGFSSPDWYTFNQVRKIKGARVQKGSKGTQVVFWKMYQITDRKTEKEKDIPLIRYYTVFNRDQIDGLKPLPKSESVVAPTPEDVEAILENLNLEAGVKFGGDRACYMPTPDGIRLPNVGDFESEDHFKSTALHEAVHATGHKSRLERDLKNGPGSPGYAFEELVAEIGSAMACASLGIEWEKLRHSDYVASWLEVLKNDKKLIVKAASKASKAVDFLLPAAEAVEEAKAA